MILVTGGTGLLGIHLLLELHRQGQTPIAIYRNRIPKIVKDKAEWIQGDILDVTFLEETMQRVTQVYHAAGLVSFNNKYRYELFSVNVHGTANIVNACIKAGVNKLVHVSSVGAMGRIRNNEHINESMYWTKETSNSVYAHTKYLGEMEVWRGAGEGLNTVIVNPTIIFGEHAGWNNGSMRIFKTIYDGFPWYSLGGAGFVDAKDVAEAMVQLMKSNITGERFLISAENKTYKELFFMIADAYGKKRPHKAVTPLLAAIVWRVEKIKAFLTKKEAFVTKETANTSLALVKVNNEKLLKALPTFNYNSLNNSVIRICKHLQEQITNYK